MTSNDRARKRAIRQRQDVTGEPFSVAARRHDESTGVIAHLVRGEYFWTIDLTGELVAPWPEHRRLILLQNYTEDDSVAHPNAALDVNGWEPAGPWSEPVGHLARVPLRRTVAGRAQDAQFWVRGPAPAGKPCPCGGGHCLHGKPCVEGCPGRLVHSKRNPGSMTDVTEWHDEYKCDTCRRLSSSNVILLDTPWGTVTVSEAGPGGKPIPNVEVFYDVDHPGFPRDDDEDEDYEDYDPDEFADLGIDDDTGYGPSSYFAHAMAKDD